MPEVIGLTEDGKEIVRHDPSEGCRYRCMTCGNWLRARPEVRGHWALFSESHSMFVDRRGNRFHQTVEGLYRRDWTVAEVGHTGEDEE